jgi:hypothetical protein
MSQYDRYTVIPRQWLVFDLEELGMFFEEQNSDAFPDGDGSENEFLSFVPEAEILNQPKRISVLGERLIERSALVANLEYGLFVRVKDTSAPMNIPLHLRDNPSGFSFENIDLEIRRSNVTPFEVVTEDKELAAFLEHNFTIEVLSP